MIRSRLTRVSLYWNVFFCRNKDLLLKAYITYVRPILEYWNIQRCTLLLSSLFVRLSPSSVIRLRRPPAFIRLTLPLSVRLVFVIRLLVVIFRSFYDITCWGPFAWLHHLLYLRAVQRFRSFYDITCWVLRTVRVTSSPAVPASRATRCRLLLRRRRLHLHHLWVGSKIWSFYIIRPAFCFGNIRLLGYINTSPRN